jgi:hypothetical protein
MDTDTKYGILGLISLFAIVPLGFLITKSLTGTLTLIINHPGYIITALAGIILGHILTKYIK